MQAFGDKLAHPLGSFGKGAVRRTEDWNEFYNFLQPSVFLLRKNPPPFERRLMLTFALLREPTLSDCVEYPFGIVAVNVIKIEVPESAKLFFGVSGVFYCFEQCGAVFNNNARHSALIVKIE